MVINAVTGDLVTVDFDVSRCVLNVEAMRRGDAFDYDVETAARMGATKAKLTRFFDVVADASFSMATRFVKYQSEIKYRAPEIRIYLKTRLFCPIFKWLCCLKISDFLSSFQNTIQNLTISAFKIQTYGRD